MKYNIVTLGTPERDTYRMMIRYYLKNIEEVSIPAVDARKVNLDEELEKRGLHIPYHNAFSIGEVGIWLSMFDCWQWSVDNNEELIVFEDDAIPARDFEDKLKFMMGEIPDDYDFVCLWVPDNQKQDYLYMVQYDDEGQPGIFGSLPEELSMFNYGAERAAMVYNGYGNVAQLFSPKGSRFFIERAREAGLYTPVDCYQYQEAHAGRCKGYGPKPKHANLVKYDWPVTTVHTTERYGEIYK